VAEDRGRRPAGGGSRQSGSGKPRSGGGKPSAGGKPSTGGRGRAERGTSGRPDAKGASAGRGGRTQQGRDWKRPTDKQADRTQEQALYDGPELPAEVTGAELDRSITSQLKGLPEKLASRVARHLAAAGLVLEDDPETAYQHTLAARARAPRLAVVREAAGEAAYAAGHYAEALAELRAAKRMNGAPDYIPMMADCHRALGNPEQALKLGKSPSVANFDPPAKAEMTLVEAGARRDMGQLDAALRTLEHAPLNSKSRQSWVVRLRYAYADTLEAAGRDQDALAWFHRTHAVDSEQITDADVRAEALEKRLG
jgi:tetratricopeptide (TPR) repeat protein